MKKFFLLLTIASAFTACNKSKDDVQSPAPSDISGKIKTWANSGNINTYTYDNQGRVVKDANSDGSSYNYEYTAGKVKVTVFSAGNVPYGITTFDLNADGLAIRETNTNDPSFEELYVYNPDKTLAKRITHQNGTTYSQDLFYSNGNCDSLRNIGANGNWQSTIVRTYYTDKANVLSDANWGENYYGAPSKNLLKTEQYKYADGSSNSLTTSTYEFDGKGRVTKRTLTYGANIGISLLTYY